MPSYQGAVCDDLCPLTSQLLDSAGFRHAFFTRLGGVSEGPYASLNLSNSVGDSPGCVAENLRRAAIWLGLEESDLYWVRQVHGNDITEIGWSSSLREVRSTLADALITSREGVACCVHTADCVPILVADTRHGRVAAIHAGWRGVVARVVLRTIDRLVKLGSEAKELIVAIGPHIRAPSFEVSEDVACQIAEVTAARSVIHREYGALPHAALVECIQAQLSTAGVPARRVDDVGGCTFEDATQYFSYRRQGSISGRHLHAIIPRKPA